MTSIGPTNSDSGNSLLLAGLGASTRKSSLRASSSNFVERNSSDDFKVSNVVASKNYAYQYENYANIQSSLKDDLTSFKAAQVNFKSIKEKVGEIKSLVKSAKDGVITGTGLNNAQDTINKLVTEINGLVDTTKVNGKKIFDGTFQQNLQNDLDGGALTVDFSRTGDMGRPLTLSANLNPGETGSADDPFKSLRVLYADDKYIVGTSQFDRNGDSSSIDGEGSVKIYDAKTKNLIREINSPMTNIDHERFGYTASVDGDKILIGTVSGGWSDSAYDSDELNDRNAYDEDFSGGAFLYDIPSGNLITSFTKDSLATKNPLVDLGIKSENDVDSDPDTHNRFSNFGSAVKIQGDRVFIYKQRNAGSDNRPGGQGALDAAGIQEFTLDGTFVKQHNITLSISGSPEDIQVTDGYILTGVSTEGTGSARSGAVNIIDRDTGVVRKLKSTNQGYFQGFGNSISVQGNKLLVGESGEPWYWNTELGVNTTLNTSEGELTSAQWNSMQNNDTSGGFGGAAHLYDIDKLVADYDAAFNAAKALGKSDSAAATDATTAMSSSSSSGHLMTFDQNTLAAQGITLNTFDAFGNQVKLEGSNVVVTARLDDDAKDGSNQVNAGSTYVFDMSKTYGATGVGELISKAKGIKFAASSGVKLYENSGGTSINEYDFSSVFGGPTTSLDIDTTVTRSLTMGSTSSRALENITVSSTVASIGGTKGLANNQSIKNMDAIESNLMRMEANFDSVIKRISNSVDRVGAKMDVLKDRKKSVDTNLGGYFNATNINVQTANRRKALDLLP